MQKLKVKRLNDDARLPTRAHQHDAGLDLYYSGHDKWLDPGESAAFPTGISIELEPGYVGMVCDRSSMALKQWKVSGGIIDSGYRGEIRVVLTNHSRLGHMLCFGDKMAQLLIMPIVTPEPVEADQLEDSQRGGNGFGSSGT